MSGHSSKNAPKDYRMQGPRASRWHKAWQVFAGLAVAGLIASALAFTGDANRFGYSYLFGFFTILTFLFGAFFMVIIEHFTAGNWGITTRRIIEVVAGASPIVALLAIPLFVGVATGQFHMYDEWMDTHHNEHEDAAHDHGDEHEAPEADHADEAEHGSLLVPRVALAQGHDDGEGHDAVHPPHTPQMEAAHHAILEHKAAFLNVPAWFARAFVYILIWLIIGVFFWRTSRKQDETKDLNLTLKMKAWTPIAATLFALTLTFASFDWLMALEPAWYSTIFGVVIFAGSAVAILAFTVMIGISLSNDGLVGDAINVEHIHDLGKLLYGFMCFWTYVSFSQWMLIWYAGIPEEATWFHRRWENGWEVWSVMLVLGHFVFPFFFLMSRVVKRNFSMMYAGAALLVVMHIADVYWYVLPHAGGLHFHIGDVGALLFTGGVFFAYILYTFTKVPLIPIGDPRLERCLQHHQSH